ncbi:hypothetical protein IRT38_00995 (plasmid) [Acinetobacter sp. SK-43]|uniref:hypothetical protein n=1 Tax=Acinetobacter sp. SK-43 TaxID=2785295 RepID=UPI00188B7197|nr:hypothetical protein [Acinetobacter sp. SK-43]MBF4453993.1 hypothetical protein [Acinetobacter sp. SK-43]
MTTIASFLKNCLGYYVDSIDGTSIEYLTEEDKTNFMDKKDCILMSQPDCDVVFHFSTAADNCNFSFNPNMPITFSNHTGYILAYDIYGIERQLKFVMNLRLTAQVFEKICAST